MPDVQLPPYLGGKKLQARWIADQLPLRAGYVEPFAGMAAVLMARPQARHEMLNDADEDIWAWWVGVRDHGDELREYLRSTPYARRELEACAARLRAGGLSVVERAAAVTICLHANYQTSMAGNPVFRAMHYKPDDVMHRQMPLSHTHGLVNIVESIPVIARRLRTVELECRDGVTVTDTYVRSSQAVVYVDPPYASTRGYRHTVDLDDLADVLRDASAAVAVSGYPSCGWDERLPDWRRVDYDRRRSRSSSARGEGMVRECLWLNFDEAALRLPL